MGRLAALLVIVLAGCAPGGAGRDGQPPPVPAGLTITSLGNGAVRVGWDPCRDDGGLKGYRVYRNGVFLRETTETSLSDRSLRAGRKYCYRVSACDRAGNESALSQPVCAMF